jgi:hypothetical protein
MNELNLALGIVLLQGLAKSKECEDLLQSAQASSEWHPAKVGEYEHNNLVVATVDREATTAEVTLGFDAKLDVISRLRLAATDIARVRFGLEVRTFSKASMSRYAVGALVGRHRDTTTFSTNRLMTCILYLNDDFDGGELLFPDVGVCLKPSCGDAVFFLSEYFHAVAPVIKGYRYCVIQFGENAPE